MVTCINSYIENSKNQKKVILFSSMFTLIGDVMMGNITFFWFLQFSMYELLHVAVKMYVNYSFFYIYNKTYHFCAEYTRWPVLQQMLIGKYLNTFQILPPYSVFK